MKSYKVLMGCVVAAGTVAAVAAGASEASSAAGALTTAKGASGSGVLVTAFDSCDRWSSESEGRPLKTMRPKGTLIMFR